MSTLGLLSFLGGIICLFGFIFSKKKLWSQILAIFGIIIVLTSFHAPAALIMGILFYSIRIVWLGDNYYH